MYIKLYKENKASQAFWYKYNQHLGYKLVLPVNLFKRRLFFNYLV